MKHLFQVLGLSFLLAISSASFAKGGHGGEGFRHNIMFRLLDELSLTDAQREQIESIRESEKAQIEALNIDRKSQFEAVKNLVNQPTFDEAAVRELLTSYQAQELEFKVIQLRAKNSLFNLLTTEQQEVLKELMMDFKHKHARHRGRN